jgi:ATP-binding cassette subfamily B protein
MLLITISRWYRRHAAGAALVLFLMSLQAGYNIFIPRATQLIFDRAIADHDLQLLQVLIGIMVAAFVARFAVTIGQDRLTARLGSRVVGEIRASMFAKLHALSQGYYARTSPGDIATHFSSDAMTMETTLLRVVPKLVYLSLNAAACSFVLFLFEWRLAAVTFIGLLVSLLVPRRLAARAVPVTMEQKRLEAEAAAFIQEDIVNQSTVKLFSLESWRRDRFRDGLDRYLAVTASAARAASLVESATTLSTAAVQILVIGLGAAMTIYGELSLGALFGFIGLLAVLTNSMFGLSLVIPPLIAAGSAVERIVGFCENPDTIRDVAGAPTLPRLARALRFEDVGFSYTGAQQHLTAVDIDIAAGESVALVGASGSGKSTLLSLLLRHHEPGRGRITIDGVELAAGTLASLRAQMAVVPQEPILFNTTIRENIRLGRLDATDAEVEQAARDAELHDLVVSWPQGYDTPVGDRGANLSGGQRQRVAIARAIIRSPAILVLDEATSALDPGTEEAVNATLARLARRHTVVSVTHRLRAAMRADRIVVLDKGRVCEQGTHDELLARAGRYAEMWGKQNGFTLDAAGGRATVTPERLRAIPLLAGLEPSALAALAHRCVPRRFVPGEVVFRRGDAGDLFYIIVRGEAELLRNGEAVADVMSDGDHFGELALLEDAPRQGTVRARSILLVLTFSRAELQELIAEPRVLSRLQAVAAERRKTATLIS